MAGSRVGSTVDSAWLVALWPLRWRVSHSHSTHTRTCMHTSTHMQMAHMHTQAHLCPCPHHVHTQYACTHMHTPTHSTHMHRQHACTRAGTYSVAPQAKAALLGQKEPCPLPGGTGPNKPADGWTGPCPAGRLQTPGLAAALCTSISLFGKCPSPSCKEQTWGPCHQLRSALQGRRGGALLVQRLLPTRAWTGLGGTRGSSLMQV